MTTLIRESSEIWQTPGEGADQEQRLVLGGVDWQSYLAIGRALNELVVSWSRRKRPIS